jgi:hypothetical protein
MPGHIGDFPPNRRQNTQDLFLIVAVAYLNRGEFIWFESWLMVEMSKLVVVCRKRRAVFAQQTKVNRFA